MNKIDQITFDLDTAKEFEQEYKKAVEEKREQFTYKGYDILTAFAKYQVEYLHTIFKF